jgi:hypothetical protein
MPKDHVRGAGRATTIWRDETTNTSLRCMTLRGSSGSLSTSRVPRSSSSSSSSNRCRARPRRPRRGRWAGRASARPPRRRRAVRMGSTAGEADRARGSRRRRGARHRRPECWRLRDSPVRPRALQPRAPPADENGADIAASRPPFRQQIVWAEPSCGQGFRGIVVQRDRSRSSGWCGATAVPAPGPRHRFGSLRGRRRSLGAGGPLRRGRLGAASS